MIWNRVGHTRDYILSRPELGVDCLIQGEHLGFGLGVGGGGGGGVPPLEADQLASSSSFLHPSVTSDSGVLCGLAGGGGAG